MLILVQYEIDRFQSELKLPPPDVFFLKIQSQTSISPMPEPINHWHSA